MDVACLKMTRSARDAMGQLMTLATCRARPKVCEVPDVPRLEGGEGFLTWRGRQRHHARRRDVPRRVAIPAERSSLIDEDLAERLYHQAKADRWSLPPARFTEALNAS